MYFVKGGNFFFRTCTIISILTVEQKGAGVACNLMLGEEG
jgi:hypothetical protein